MSDEYVLKENSIILTNENLGFYREIYCPLTVKEIYGVIEGSIEEDYLIFDTNLGEMVVNWNADIDEIPYDEGGYEECDKVMVDGLDIRTAVSDFGPLHFEVWDTLNKEYRACLSIVGNQLRVIESTFPHNDRYYKIMKYINNKLNSNPKQN